MGAGGRGHDSRPPAEHGSPARPALELDAIASVVGEELGSPTSKAGQGSPCTFFNVCFGVLYFLVACAVISTLWWAGTYKEPNYTVAIAAVSGLDPATDIGRRPALDPEFNLTVSIVLHSALRRGRCDELGTTLMVAYRGYELASAAAPQVCSDLGGDRMNTTVVARGTRVWLPATVRESLSADVWSAAGVLDVTIAIRMIAGHSRYRGDGLLVSCMGRPVGDEGGAALCDTGVLHLPRAH